MTTPATQAQTELEAAIAENERIATEIHARNENIPNKDCILVTAEHRHRKV